MKDGASEDFESRETIEESVRRRREELCEGFDADYLLLTSRQNVYYYSDFQTFEPSLAGEHPAFLLIDSASRETTLLTDNFAGAAAEEAIVDELRSWNWYDTSRAPGAPPWSDSLQPVIALLQEKAPAKSGKRIRVAVESGLFPDLRLAAGASPLWGTVDLVDITARITNQRRQKDPLELSRIRRAVAVAKEGHLAAREQARPGMTEMDLFIAIESAMAKENGAPVRLIGDFLSGPRGNRRSGPPTLRKLAPGDGVILDLSPVVNGYRADYTTTLVLADTLTPYQKSVEEALHNALDAGEATLRPGVPARDVYAAVHNALAGHESADSFDHHAGHGIGLGHPEAPFFVPADEATLLSGDVVTLEPGLYRESFSARIEHMYLITDTGAERLTSHPTRFRR